MQFSDLKGTHRGQVALLCLKDTPKDLIESFSGIKIGNVGRTLDFKMITEAGRILLGYREEERKDSEGMAFESFHIEERIYLHAEPLELREGRICSEAPFMSLAYQLGCVEIHTPHVENEGIRRLIEAEGVKVIVLNEEVEKAPEVKAPEKQETVVKKVKKHFNKKIKKRK